MGNDAGRAGLARVAVSLAGVKSQNLRDCTYSLGRSVGLFVGCFDRCVHYRRDSQAGNPSGQFMENLP